MNGALCSAKLRNGDPCRSVATDAEFCAHHAALAGEGGSETVAAGHSTKKRTARQRLAVVAESEPVELSSRFPSSPSAVRPALALTAAEEVETMRRVLLDAATSTTRVRTRSGPDSRDACPSRAEAMAPGTVGTRRRPHHPGCRPRRRRARRTHHGATDGDRRAPSRTALDLGRAADELSPRCP